MSKIAGKEDRKVRRSDAGASEHAPGKSVGKGGKILRWMKRAFLGLGVLVIALAGAGATYQTVATEMDERRYPPPGQLVDAGGHWLHLNVMGEDRDGPTVILEAGGMGGMSSQWAWVQPEIAEFARVVSYDRAGLGWSEPGRQAHDARHISQQLHTALEEAGIGGPYVLVGHSMGGLYARQFAGDYPDEVAGMVLLDSSHPDQGTRLEAEGLDQQIVQMLTAQTVLARLGGLRSTTPRPKRRSSCLLGLARRPGRSSPRPITWPLLPPNSASEMQRATRCVKPEAWAICRSWC